MAKMKTPSKNPSLAAAVAAKGSKAAALTNDALIQTFQNLSGSLDFLCRIIDDHPTPMQIFALDGTCVYMNKAWLEMINCKDPSLLVGKYNLLKDPVCMEQLGYGDEIRNAFKGEIVIGDNFPAPIQDVFERGVINEKPWEAAIMDFYLYPVWSPSADGVDALKKELAFVVCLFYVIETHKGRPAVARAKAYIDTHWKEPFSAQAVTHEAGMSSMTVYKWFQKEAGMTLEEYYNRVKVKHIKDKLVGGELTVKEAFAACGTDERSGFGQIFKRITGMTPKEYQKSYK
jgi:AraC-like DNA-binding protein